MEILLFSAFIVPSGPAAAEATLADIVQGGNLQPRFPDSGSRPADNAEGEEINLPSPGLPPAENDPAPENVQNLEVPKRDLVTIETSTDSLEDVTPGESY